MKKKFFTPLNILIVLVYIGISAYVYYGFYFPDPTIIYIHWSVYYIQWGIRILFPVIAIGLIFLYRSLYLKEIKVSSVILLFFTVFFLALLFYPIADIYYNITLTRHMDKVHSYLQIQPPSPGEYDPNNFNIFCLGGSTTEFKDEHGRDWPRLVEEILNKNSNGKKVKLFNYGKQWYSTQHILINYELNLRQYKPNAIIVMEDINDLLHNADFSWLSSGTYRSDYGNFFGPLARVIKFGSFASFLKATVSGLWYCKKDLVIETDIFPGLKSFERNLKTIISLANEDSTAVILMTQPNIYKMSMSAKELKSLSMLNGESIGNGKKWSTRTALSGFQQYNNKIKEVALLKKIPLIDLEQVVPKSLEYFYDDVHYTSKSYDLIAPYLAKELKVILKPSLNKISN